MPTCPRPPTLVTIDTFPDSISRCATSAVSPTVPDPRPAARGLGQYVLIDVNTGTMLVGYDYELDLDDVESNLGHLESRMIERRNAPPREP